MIVTCVSVGSGNASIVRPRNAYTPATISTAVKNRTAPRLASEKRTMRSNMTTIRRPSERSLGGEIDGVQQQQGSLRHVRLAGRQTADDLHLPGALAAERDLAPLQRIAGAAHEDERLLI